MTNGNSILAYILLLSFLLKSFVELKDIKDKMQKLKKTPFDDDPNAREVIDIFHQIYYYSSEKTWENTFWLGWPTLKCPLDMWVYQEIIFEVKPDVIIETGTYFGGSALFFAMLLDRLQKGIVVTIDILERQKKRPDHNRIRYITGSSVSSEVVKQVELLVEKQRRVMVILDSDHTKHHVLEELNIYSRFVDTGSYIIVEDTDLNGHPVKPEFGPGPMEAVDEFLKKNSSFAIDYSREKFLMTQNPGGYLKRIK